MKYPTFVRFISAIVAISCVSCGDDPKLVEKRDRQKAEIARLTGELALIEEKLKNMPADVSEDLATAKKEAERQAAEIARMESELTELAARKRTLQAEFDAYRVKYQLK